jgi:ornithine cyclodeaminase/alanine dehydrogenase-like protein (mu-crystallin family)
MPDHPSPLARRTAVPTYDFRYVSNLDAKALLTPAQSVRIAEETLLDHYYGDVSFAAVRQLDMAVPGQPTNYKAKGCVLGRLGVAGFRVLSLNRTPEGYAVAGHRPTKHILLSDTRSGEFFGIVDEHWSHALRTGACAAAAAKYLMRPGSDVLAVTGTGYMAYASLVAMTAVITPREVRIWARDFSKAQAFATRMSGELGLNVVAYESARACVKDVPLVITATSSPTPYLEKDWFAPGVFIYALGNFQEVDLATYQGMTFMVDERKQVRICPDIAAFIAQGIYDDDWVRADLGEVVARPDLRRCSDDEQIIVRSQGLVTQDVAQAFWIYEEACRRDMGISLESALTGQAGAALF